MVVTVEVQESEGGGGPRTARRQRRAAAGRARSCALAGSAYARTVDEQERASGDRA